jgi:hypothetical protein
MRGVLWIAVVVLAASAVALAVLGGGATPGPHAATAADSHPNGAHPTGSGPGTAPATGVAADCGSRAQAQLSEHPATIVIACADGGIGLQDLHWTAWSATSATGTGTLWLNLCTPDCALGTIAHYRAEVTLSTVVRGTSGPAFTQVSLVYPGASPTDASGAVLSEFGLSYPGS